MTKVQAPIPTGEFRHDDALEPDPFLTNLRATPVCPVRMPYGKGNCWLVTDYANVKTVTTDRRFSRAALIGTDYPRITPVAIAQPEAINLMDPPVLNRLRHVVATAFTTACVEKLRPFTRKRADQLLDDIAASGQPADVMAGLAHRLPLIVISELLGVPEADRSWLREQTVAMMSMSPDTAVRAAEAKAELRRYFGELSAARRGNPSDDLISALATAHISDKPLSAEELAVLAMLLLVSGHDTTTNQIGNIVYMLLSRPDAMAWLRADPDGLPRAIEELLRYIPFRQGVGIPRVATQDLELDGVAIAAGDFVHVSYLAANRDPAVYDQPDGLDFDRTDSPPHLTFGYGPHRCLGSHLARMVLHEAIDALLARFPRLHLAVPPEQVAFNTGSIWRHPIALPVAW
ncbi:MAG: cytochrome P450 [Nocardiaceae bacterium]|nr:cytochrome P450 [Nocardiaceae bacterium]